MPTICGVEVKEILKFKATPGFGQWKRYWEGTDAVSHPAKMNLNLLQYLVQTYTEEGDIICDPLAGTGSTGVICALNGRHCIQVELEERFYSWMEQARKNVENAETLNKKGKIINILGDSRRLSELIKEHEGEISAILSSPPYGESMTKRRKGCSIFPELNRSREMPQDTSDDNIANLPHGNIDNVIFSPPYASVFRHNPQDKQKRIEKLRQVEEQYVKAGKKWAVSSDEALTREVDRQDWGYGGEPSNIGNLPFGFDTVLFSPPYSLGHDSGNRASAEYEWRLNEQWKHTRAYRSNGNIAKLPISVCLFSPPYSETLSASKMGRMTRTGESQILQEKHLASTYTPNLDKSNIGNLPMGDISSGEEYEMLVDGVLSSPPYFDARSDWDETSRARREGEMVSYADERHEERKNIGNIHYFDEGEPLSKKHAKARGKETYLEAMSKVYSECFKILKPRGRMIIVIKDFIRNFKVIRLHDYTIKLCEKVGFVLDEVLAFKLPHRSFWRTRYRKAYKDKLPPDIELLDYEFIFVFHKSGC